MSDEDNVKRGPNEKKKQKKKKKPTQKNTQKSINQYKNLEIQQEPHRSKRASGQQLGQPHAEVVDHLRDAPGRRGAHTASSSPHDNSLAALHTRHWIDVLARCHRVLSMGIMKILEMSVAS